MIETHNLTKYYGSLGALVDLNLRIEAGRIFGFIGPNGAGKTTTMRILATLLAPTRGVAAIDGLDVARNGQQVRRRVGYMPDFMGVYDDLKVYEYLEFFAAAFSIPRRQRHAVVDGVLELTDLRVKQAATVDSLSRGMQQRLALARVLIHDPKVLILDEPASGLDPRARIEIRELLLELKGMGKTIMISSHILSELEQICDEVGIIEGGRLLFSGPLANLRQMPGIAPKIRIRIGRAGGTARTGAGDGPAHSPTSPSPWGEGRGEGRAEQGAAHVISEADRAARLLSGLPSVAAVQVNEDELCVTMVNGAEPDGLLAKTLVTAGIDVISLAADQMRLDEAFMHLTRGIVQ